MKEVIVIIIKKDVFENLSSLIPEKSRWIPGFPV